MDEKQSYEIRKKVWDDNTEMTTEWKKLELERLKKELKK